MKKTIFTILLSVAVLFLNSCSKNTDTTVELKLIPNPVSVKYEGRGVKEASRERLTEKIDRNLAPEEYILDTRRGKIRITAGSQAGIFWAKQTLEQIYAQCETSLPGVVVEDKPLFPYRGAHLDCCRHFFTIDEIKTFIDMMALHKLNVFHWHLTEDQGWRAEIKSYPKLTEIGSVRAETLVGRYGSNKYDGTPYGGFYTQDEMRDIVAYAAERHITVIPEIEMPGHASAALASYPELGCKGKDYKVQTTWGVFPEVFCAGNPETLVFLKAVFDEICEIFPSEYIHIGGDEAPRNEWEKCPRCQALMKEKGYTREAELQSYLITEIEKYLAEKGRKIIGWDEILEGGVSRSATVMSWRGASGGIDAARMGNDVVMTPNSHFYFDYYQTGDPGKNGEPLAIGGNLPLRKSYSFDPYDQLNEDEKAHIKGIQANMWTEYVATFDHVQHMVLPRFAALSEIAWNPDGRSEYEDFVSRLENSLIPVYKSRGYRYADYAFRNIE